MWLKRKTLLILSLVCLIQLSAAKAECPIEPSIELVNLLRVAGTSDECLTEARLVFHQKYFGNTISITGPFTDDENAAIKHRIFDIRLQNMNIIRTMLNTFGDLIHEINISFMEIDEVDGTAIIELIAVNCQQSLRHFEIFSIKENVFDGLQNKTFPNVTEFYFSSASKKDFEIKGNATKFDRVFPSVVDLDLTVIRAGEWALIGDDFPALKKLRVDLAQAHGHEHSRHISSLIEHSSKIELLFLTKPTHDILKAANDFLPKLSILDLKNTVNALPNSHLNFKTVHNLRIGKLTTDKLPTNLFFPNLVKFDLDLIEISNVSGDFFRFIESQINCGLSKFSLSTEHLTAEQLLRIPDILHKLKYIQILSIDAMNYTANDVITLMGRLTNAEILGLQIPMNESEKMLLQNHLHIWNTDGRYFSISKSHIDEERDIYNINIYFETNESGSGIESDSGLGAVTIVLIIAASLVLCGVLVFALRRMCGAY